MIVIDSQIQIENIINIVCYIGCGHVILFYIALQYWGLKLDCIPKITLPGSDLKACVGGWGVNLIYSENFLGTKNKSVRRKKDFFVIFYFDTSFG